MEKEFDVYRKCTYSDVIVPFNSFYPLEHKLATLRFLTNRLKTYLLRNKVIKQEILYIQNKPIGLRKLKVSPENEDIYIP